MNFRVIGAKKVKAEDALLDHSRAVIFYLPYGKKGHEIRIIRLDGKKEVVIKVLEGKDLSKAELIKYYTSKRLPGRGGYPYLKESQCHYSSSLL